MMYVKTQEWVCSGGSKGGKGEKSWSAFGHELLKQNWSTMGFMPSYCCCCLAVGD